MTQSPCVENFMNTYMRSNFYGMVRAILPKRTIKSPPYEMICSPPDAKGYVEWQPVDSPLDEKLVSAFERFLEVKLPPDFKAYLMSKCLYDPDLHFAILPEIEPAHPLGWLEWCVKAKRNPQIQARPGYLPFTASRAEMGYLCFDTRKPDGNGDYPIVGVASYPTVRNWLAYRSFKEFLETVTNFLEYELDKSEERQTFRDWLAERRKPIPPDAYEYGPTGYQLDDME